MSFACVFLVAAAGVRLLAQTVPGADAAEAALALLPLVFHPVTGTVAPVVAVLRALALGSPAMFVRDSQDTLASFLTAQLAEAAAKPAAERALTFVSPCLVISS